MKRSKSHASMHVEGKPSEGLNMQKRGFSLLSEGIAKPKIDGMAALSPLPARQGSKGLPPSQSA